MKNLQNNFTTPEQSKRLLELGVPADSADCIYPCYKREGEGDKLFMYGHINIKHPAGSCPKCFIPCWSVGRLIEIHTICCGASSSYYISAFPTNILNEVMWHLTEAVRHGWIDFSKLEE